MTGSVAAATMIDQTAGAGAARADTSPPMTVYVDYGAKNCLDAATAGTQAVPFCTLQYAANAAVPGQTILASEVNGGGEAPVTLTHSGTPSAPISIKYPGTGFRPQAGSPTGAVVPLVFDKVHDVSVSGLAVQGGPTDAIDVIGSQDITIDSTYVGMSASGTSSTPDPAGVSVDGTSSGITISRSQFSGGRVTDGIRVAPGAANVTISTNLVVLNAGTPVSVTGAAGLNLTSNTLKSYCDAADVTGTSSATIENNIFITLTSATTCPTAPLAALSVDKATAATARSDYNYFPYESGSTPVSWAGTGYSDEPSFTAATGQGAHDTIMTGTSAPPAGESTPIDSADCTAPGELATDYRGEPHVDDPLIPDTGVGTCYADRGAYEQQDVMPFGDTVTQSVPTTSGTVTVQLSNAPATSSGTNGWNEPLTYTADWGDGSGVDTIAANSAVTHQYLAAGTYTITLTAADTGGSTNVVTSTVTAYTPTAPTLTLSASARNSAGAITADMATFTAALADPADAWEVKSAQINFGQGASDAQPISLSPSAQVTGYYTKPGTYTATLTATDALGRTSTATLKVTVGNLIRLLAPVVDYSRTVPANGTVQLWYNTLHLGVDDQGALLAVTVTSATKPGYVIVYDSSNAARPNQATLQFAAGQQASNVTLATVNEFVNFYNGSSAPITLTVTTIGAESPEGSTSGDTYVPVAPASVLPPFKVAANQNALAAVAGSHGVPANAAAVVLDVTAAGGTAAGHLISYPERLPAQQQQGAYWAKGQAVTSLAVVPAGGRADLRNTSSGTVTFSAQVVGYFTANGPGPGAAFFPSARARVLAVTLAGRQSVTVPVTGKNGVLPGSDAVMVNLTALNAAAPGSITAWADGTARPAVTSLSYANGQTNVNVAVVGAGPDGSIDLYNNGTRPVTVVVDLLGSFCSY